MSPQIEDMLGYPRDAWLTDDDLWVRVLHPDDLERMLEEDARARVAARVRRPSSTACSRATAASSGSRETAAFVTDEATGDVYWQGVMVDITARKAGPGGARGERAAFHVASSRRRRSAS